MLSHLSPVIEIILSLTGILVIGSVFAIISNNTIDRIAKNQPLTTPSPYCPACAVTLQWKDMIPIVSYLIAKGKCPYCGADIPRRNILIEISEIIWVGLFIIKFGWNYPALLEMLFGMCLIAIIVIEYERRVLSESLLLFMIMLSTIYVLAFNHTEFPRAITSMIIGSSVLIIYNLLKIITLKTKRIEFREIKFGAVLGLFFGLPLIYLCILLSWLIGAIWGSINIRFFRQKPKYALPDYPFILAISALVMIMFGDNILAHYNRWIL